MIEPIVRVVKHAEQEQPTVTPRLEQQRQPLREIVDQRRGHQEVVNSPLAHVVPNIVSAPPLSAEKQSSDEQVFPSDHPSSVIRISIGRIEVRAISQSPAPIRRLPPSHPKMSLDEYLRDRNKGQR